jgi:hypothetical protein
MFACLATAGLIAVGGVIDHHVKQGRINRAELAEWYCVHEHTDCGGASSAGIEARWNKRETGYEIAVAAVGGVGLLGAAFARVKARRP